MSPQEKMWLAEDERKMVWQERKAYFLDVLFTAIIIATALFWLFG